MSKRSIALVAVALLAMAACDDAPESGRTVVTISNFNQGAPVQSDVVVDNGTDPAYVAEDIIPATFVARPYNDLVTGTSHSQVVIESYHIAWTRTDGGTGALPARDEASAIYITVGEDTDALIRLVTWGDKNNAILTVLANSPNQVGMRADITFHGREVGTEQDVELQTSVSVNFSDAINTQ